MSSLIKRALAKPIYNSKNAPVEVAKPLVCAPVDIVIDGDDDDDSSIEEVTLNVTGNVIRNVDDYWTYISSLKWADRGNYKHLKSNALRLTGELTDADRISIGAYNSDHRDALITAFNSKKIFANLERTLNDNEKLSLIVHVIFRGKHFYATVLEDPLFIGYLVGKTKQQDEFVHLNNAADDILWADALPKKMN
jgi:hypothetical protein